jgi:hypothetical protein
LSKCCPCETKDLDRIEVTKHRNGSLTAVQVALLTIYDMCKAVDRGMVMGDVKLLEKSGTWVVGKQTLTYKTILREIKSLGQVCPTAQQKAFEKLLGKSNSTTCKPR